MYRCVATIHDDGSIVLEHITTIGQMGEKERFQSLAAVPEDVGNKIKQLMWLKDDDQGYIHDVGTRVGKRIFWVV